MAAVAGPGKEIRKETGNAVLEIETAPGKTEKFVCQFNPTEYTIAADGSLAPFKTIGAQQDLHQVSVGNAKTLTLHLIFDISSILEFDGSTGKDVTESKEEDISPYMNMLLSTVEIEGKTHQPPSVRFVWGSTNFLGRVKSARVTYTMFGLDGMPVRSEVDLVITEDGKQETKKRQSPKSSPDRTKSIVLTQDKSLRSIAYEEYGSASYWRLIARANGILDPSSVPVGIRLAIPALEENV